jgi:hypothetical protein
MKIMCVFRQLLVAVVIAALGCMAAAQESPIHKGATEMSVWGQGGSGLGAADTTQMMSAGVRFGRIMTDVRGSGWMRGNFEYAFDTMPLYLFFQDQTVCQGPIGPNTCSVIFRRRQTVYGGGVTPVILKWNFVGNRRVVPFVAAEGGVVFTTGKVPDGNTSTVNFTPGIAGGVQWLRGRRGSFSVSGHLTHVSNASLGDFNPGLNSTLQLRLSYQWWR